MSASRAPPQPRTATVSARLTNWHCSTRTLPSDTSSAAPSALQFRTMRPCSVTLPVSSIVASVAPSSVTEPGPPTAVSTKSPELRNPVFG
ncbi:MULTISPECIES: hypothetical protein [unclassified Spirillospora]|uniref:hypothetical protein n=1 Tax=unclassified Spirillospora TaxID=2642701 RepID=UPI0037227D38